MARASVFPLPYPIDKTGWPLLDDTNLQQLVAKPCPLPYGKIPEGNEKGLKKRDWRHNKAFHIGEKYDGSLFSFAVENGTMYFWSRAASLTDIANQYYRGAMIALLTKFKRDPTAFKDNELWHGETITRRKHSSLEYDRVPVDFFISFDIQYKDTGAYMKPQEVASRSLELGYTTATILFDNLINGSDEKETDAHVIAERFMALVNRNELKSSLGGKMEGIILKCHEYTWPNGKVSDTKQKFVRDDFREKKIVKDDDKKFDVNSIGSAYDVAARFHKSFQRYKQLHPTITYKLNAESYQAISADLDNDLELEQKESICESLRHHEPLLSDAILWKKYKHAIMRSSRASLTMWLKESLKEPRF